MCLLENVNLPVVSSIYRNISANSLCFANLTTINLNNLLSKFL